MIPIIVPPIIPSLDKDPYRRRPNILGILLSMFILSIGIFIAFFLFLTGEFSSPIPILGIIILLIVISMGLVVFTIVEPSVSHSESEREEYRQRPSPIKNYTRDRRNSEYCPECGTLVELSDRYCTTCGSRLD